jgi:hypothetical protein
MDDFPGIGRKWSFATLMSGLEIARFEMKKMKNWGLEPTILLDISNN